MCYLISEFPVFSLILCKFQTIKPNEIVDSGSPVPGCKLTYKLEVSHMVHTVHYKTREVPHLVKSTQGLPRQAPCNRSATASHLCLFPLQLPPSRPGLFPVVAIATGRSVSGKLWLKQVLNRC